MLTLNFNPFPVLTTERLILRKVKKSDVEEIFLMRSDKSVMKYIDRPLAVSRDDAFEHIKRVEDLLNDNNGITWAMVEKKADTLIGSIGIWRVMKEHYRGEIGYMLNPAFHRKGLMHEALKTVLDYGFEHMNLHSVEGIVNPGNEASIKLLEKNNFVREAYFKENYYHNGQS